MLFLLFFTLSTAPSFNKDKRRKKKQDINKNLNILFILIYPCIQPQLRIPAQHQFKVFTKSAVSIGEILKLFEN